MASPIRRRYGARGPLNRTDQGRSRFNSPICSSRRKPRSFGAHQNHGSRTECKVLSRGAHMAAPLTTAAPLRTVDTDEKHAPNLKPVLRMSARAVEGQAFEQANTTSAAAVEEVQRRIGAAACEVTSRLSELYSAARRQTANSCDRLARRCHRVASRTVHHVRRTKEEQPLRLLGIIAGVAFAAGVAVRIWRSSHE